MLTTFKTNSRRKVFIRTLKLLFGLFVLTVCIILGNWNPVTYADDSSPTIPNNISDETPRYLIYLPAIFRQPQPEWEQLSGTQGHYMEVVRSYGNGVFAGDLREASAGGGIYRAEGCTISTDFVRLQPAFQVLDLDFSLDGHGLAASYAEKVFFSADPASSWTQTTSNMSPYVYAVVFTQSGNSFAGADDGVYFSTDTGNSWLMVNPASGSNPKPVNSFAYNADTDENTLWIGTYGNGVSIYDIENNQFTERKNGLSNDAALRVWDVFVDSPSERIYIATDDGVYSSTKNSDFWTKINGLPPLNIRSLEVSYGVLYAGTKGDGIWRMKLSTPGVWTREQGIPADIVRDLRYDSELCGGLLAATNNGIWVLR